MRFYELSPAYGRDYKSAKDVRAAWDADLDFEGDYQLGFQPVNRADIPAPCTVLLRYARCSKVVAVKVPATGRTNATAPTPDGGV